MVCTPVMLALIVSVLISATSGPHQQVYAAGCVAPTTDYGTVMSNITIAQTGTYRAWTRMAAANTTDNTYLLDIDGTSCYIVGGSSVPTYSLGATTYFQNNGANWISNTSTAAAIDLSLSAGAHVIKMIGLSNGVVIDRMLFAADTTCLPTGTGDNCVSVTGTTAPFVSVSSAISSATVAGQVVVSVDATDPGSAVTRVDLYVDNLGTGAIYATDTSSPYNFTITGLSVGTHTVVARATNASALSDISTVFSVNVLDITAPNSVVITVPINNAIVSGSFPIYVTAADNVLVTRIEFLVDGTVKANDTSSPWSSTIDTTIYSNGLHFFTIKAYDAVGNVTTSNTTTVTINNVTGMADTTPPIVSVPLPAGPGGSSPIIAGRTYQIRSNVTDASGIQKVEFQFDGVTKASVTTPPFVYNIDTTALTPGTHSLSVRATDTASNVSAYTMIPIRVTDIADVTTDCRINFSDISAVIPKLGLVGTTYGLVDVTNDGRINFSDISAIIPKLGRVPCT